MSLEISCFDCGKEISLEEEKVSFREECPHCGADVHVCKNCRFYDPKAYHECSEPSADYVKDKERNNYCDYFEASSEKKSGGKSKEDLRAAAEALFKKK